MPCECPKIRDENFSIFLKALKVLAENTLIRFAGFELDSASRSLKREGNLIALTPKTFDLLLYLAAHPHQIVTKDKLLAAVWPDSYVEESNLSQHVFLLRKALAGTGRSDGLSSDHVDRIVVTIPGKGYQFAAKVDSGPGMSAELATKPQANASTSAFTLHSVRSVTSLVVEEELDESDDVSGLNKTERSQKAGPLLLPALGGRSRQWLWAVTGLLLVAATSVLVWHRLHPVSANHLNLVVADLENTTHDPDFDHTLNQAVQIDLEQSPYLNLLSRSAIQQTLSEMQRPSDTALTPAVAREICERNNAQAVLSATLSRFGSRYLFVLNANSCVSEKQIAGAKGEASSKDEVLQALDSAAGRLRQQLGESSASLERFQMPVAQATTSSLDALRAYTQGAESFEHGDMVAAQGSYERAIELDPGFASAYKSLGATYYERCDNAHAALYFRKAFELRKNTTERERLSIEIANYGYGLNDIEEAIRRTRQFLETYPNDSGSWSWTNLANLYTQLGEYPQAIDAGEHALRIDPHSAAAAQMLARAYKQANRFADAKRVANASIAEGRDLWLTHSILFQIATAEGDTARIHSEGEWGLTHLNANMTLDDLGLAAATRGRLHEALVDFARARAESLRNADQEYADGILLDQAEILAVFDEAANIQPSLAAASALKQIKVDVGDPGDVVLTQALAGDIAPAQHFAADAESASDRDTVKVYVDLPLVRALLALKANKANEALQLLEPARPYQLRDFRVPYLRAQAEEEANLPDAAVQDYRLILANQGVDPISPLYPLARLKLARLLLRQKKTDQSRTEFQAFLKAWKDADPDSPILIQARREFTAISGN